MIPQMINFNKTWQRSLFKKKKKDRPNKCMSGWNCLSNTQASNSKNLEKKETNHAPTDDLPQIIIAYSSLYFSLPLHAMRPKLNNISSSNYCYKVLNRFAAGF